MLGPGFAGGNAFAQIDEAVVLDTGDVAAIPLRKVSNKLVDIDIDGHLDEAIWRQIEPIGKLRVTEPDTLADVPYATQSRIFYTEKGLYVSFDMEQPPDTLIERAVPRDAFDVNRDNVGFTLDTSGSGRYGYWMNMSLGDSEMDGTILPERQYKRDWDGAWYGATSRTDKGWVAEFFVPWSQMAMPKSGDIRRIGIYISRKVAYLDERWGWPGLTDTKPRFMSAMQPLELEKVDPRQQWSLFPYASATMDRVTNDSKWQTGADVFWRPSTNFQLTATLNPDFGAVESDNVVVNLTADETFFPEKRLFFQEGQEIFNVSGREEQFRRQPLRIVNTRRIGSRPRALSLPDGVALTRRQEIETADVIAALKATGQVGAIRYGFLAASEDDTGYIATDNQFYSMPGRDFGVMRLLYEDSKGAAYRAFGWISTIVAHPESDAVVHGADAHYLSTSGRWNLNGEVIHSDRDESGAGTGILADIAYTPRQGVKHQLLGTFLDDGIDVNDLGFQLRNNVDQLIYRFNWTKSGLSRVRDFKLDPFLRYERNRDGFRTNGGIGTSGSVTLNGLHTISGFLAYFPHHFDDRNSFGHGTFRIRGRWFSDLTFRSNTSKAVSIVARVGTRPEFIYGTSIETQAGITWQALDNLSMDLNVMHKDWNGWLLHQEEQNFTGFSANQWQPQFNLNFYPTSKQQIRLAMQWVGVRAKEDRFFTLPVGTNRLLEGPKPPGGTDDFSISQLNFQVRYRWQIAPLSDLFIVYTRGDNRRTSLMSFGDLFSDNWNDPLGDFLVIKLRYRLGS